MSLFASRRLSLWSIGCLNLGHELSNLGELKLSLSVDKRILKFSAFKIHFYFGKLNDISLRDYSCGNLILVYL